ncbi:hypothetical protein [Flavobacterium inviolabile]|uniref:hypothetical protein n=1 Tax=Flavobacterium inviolabile TaxID=2748320 RepID=UPI0015ADCF76|nr:hypothetical protein [Flavobacterium inviolabile]
MGKLTEDETVIILCEYLKQNDWIIESYCLGRKQGIVIVASKLSMKLAIEVKGAKANDKSPIKKREFFDSGQIKTHLGKALVKVLEEKHLNPKINIAIAHPDDVDIRKNIGHLIPFLKHLGIKHFWVFADGTVIEE